MQYKGGEEICDGYVVVFEWVFIDIFILKVDVFILKFDLEVFVCGFRVKLGGVNVGIINFVVVNNSVVGGMFMCIDSSFICIELVNDDN